MISTTLFLSALVTFAQPLPEYRTASGKIYTLAPNAPAAMQPAYVDDMELIWGDVIPNFKGQAMDAQALCYSIVMEGEYGKVHARLPLREEAERLRNSMSADPSQTKAYRAIDGNPAGSYTTHYQSTNLTYDSDQPALPNIRNEIWLLSYSYLSGIGSPMFETFNGSDVAQVIGGTRPDHSGRIGSQVVASKARCVMPVTPEKKASR